MNLDDYDLFLKIDDDDVYRTHYVESVVADFEKHSWDFSGNHSVGVINGARWRPELVYKNLGAKTGDEDIGMSGTWAFSRAAINEIVKIEETSFGFEDMIWEGNLKNNPAIKTCRRENNSANYIYHIHGKNISTGDWLEEQQEEAQEQQKASAISEEPMNGITSMRFAFHFMKKALPMLPRDVTRYIKRKLT